MYSHKAIVLVAVAVAVKTLICLIKLPRIKPSKWPNNKQPNEHKKRKSG